MTLEELAKALRSERVVHGCQTETGRGTGTAGSDSVLGQPRPASPRLYAPRRRRAHQLPWAVEDLQGSAVRVRDELVRLAERRRETSNAGVTLARVQQLDNELAALDSRILVERRRRSER